MRRGFRKTQRILGKPAGPVQTPSRSAPQIILRRNREGAECGARPGSRSNSETRLFCQQGIAGPRSEISGFGESSIGSSVFGEEVAPLLPEFYSVGDDRLTYPEGPEETRCGWKKGKMGGRVVGVRHQV